MKIFRTFGLAIALAWVIALAFSASTALAADTDPNPIQAPSHNISYTVQAGDSWVTISKKFGVSASRLLDINNLRNRADLLYAGQSIVVPITLDTTPSLTTPFIYVVQAGDTLPIIAERFYIDRFALLQANRISSSSVTLSPGQQLLIPPGPRRYVVRSGDTLASIAAMFGTTVSTMRRNNPALTSDAVLVAGSTRVFFPLVYDAAFMPIPGVSGSGGAGVSIPGVGATTSGGGSTTGGTTTISRGLNASGLNPTPPNPDEIARQANALARGAFETLSMPGNVVNLGQPLQVRWLTATDVLHPTNKQLAIITLRVEFRGGDGTYTVRNFYNNNGQSLIRGVNFSGVYVKVDNGELWNQIDVTVENFCGEQISNVLMITTGGKTYDVKYDTRTTNCQP